MPQEKFEIPLFASTACIPESAPHGVPDNRLDLPLLLAPQRLLFSTSEAAATPWFASNIVPVPEMCIRDRKKDLKRLPHIIKPAAILLGGMLCLNLIMGFVIHKATDLDWITSFMCAVPGGMSDTPIIAADMGGNGGKVAVCLLYTSRCV